MRIFLGQILAVILLISGIVGQVEEVMDIFSDCRKSSPDFDKCIQRAFNDLRPLFSVGIPELNVAPFDPHRSPYVEQRRGDARGLGGFRLILTNVSEHGWTNSEVTKYRTDAPNNRIVYSQFFPEKSLEGEYSFKMNALGRPSNTRGVWNLTLYNYSQTTSVTRIGGPGGLLKVRVEIDKIGDMSMHISNFFGGRRVLENIADVVINSMWQTGFPFIKPLINDLVSTAFTDIFNESFRHFPLDRFIKD
ncbi:uncharacterized protein LOC129797712 [Lutzomyia longipalpis]|uniref:uncharacterized protein LOC129797712 n=1 Tax=Lutzomyia longipalpis TaxID=7200 RepID=UPI0024840150|nr:uncharacterized protein LOC129797712 [Lutzomyia longipalpis]